ncbi:MAG: alpha/beta hydrolase [Pseudomonadota bacterium]
MSNAFEGPSGDLHSALSFDLEHDASVERVLTPLWKEARWPLELLKLRMDGVRWGLGIPHGQGQPVLLIPGFMAGDIMMLEMYRWLRRIGYRAHLSNIPWNNDCPDKTGRKLVSRARAIHAQSGKKVRLIGHSLGGMLSKFVVQEAPEVVDRVITMGSPFRDLVKAHPAIVGIWDELKNKRSKVVGRNLKTSCGTGHCTCAFVKNMLQPKRVAPAQFAVYSKCDGVVEWTSCVEDDEQFNSEVGGTHIGLVYNAEAYKAVATRLAQNIDSSKLEVFGENNG